MNIKLSVINHKNKKEEGKKERGHQSEESLMNPGTNLFVSQGNVRVRDKGINTSPFTIYSTWVTAKRLKRGGRSLGCHS
jgi:hypothetical protein